MTALKIIKIGIAIVLVSGLMQTALAEEKEIKKTVVTKEITGEVSGIRKNFVAIVYKREKGVESEMAFPIEEIPKLERIKNLEDIQLGDTVTVGYDEVTAIDEYGQEITKRLAKTIKFVKPAPLAVPPQPWEESVEP